ncbi:helix-turn-helix domain-containing protein [Anaerococcus provencensis]|uniref:helix-turn-helix domain-containing protein n=1 Tax=Anaerococcus provencensis TaxID=938293 RepID=UPI0002DA825C|nr:helix-turn-helix transcriptional regulator [Anaerococcus provencensis]
MILADKIINLRKKESMTQEDLAHEIGVSRQSVSKWESSMAMPDLDKIVKLSNIFGVSTDFLLNDDLGMENIIVNDNEESKERLVDFAALNEYYDSYEKIARSIALAIPLFILSSLPVLILGGTNEGLAIVLTLILVAISVATCIHAGFVSDAIDYVEKESYTFAYGVEGVIKKNLDAYMPTLKRNVIIAVLLYILSPIGYVVENPAKDGYNIVFLVLIALATSLISYTLIKYSSLRDILAYRDPKKQKKESWMNKFSAILWISTIAIFLIYSYTSGNWGRSWLIFVIAGVIQIAVSIIFD